MESGDSNVFDFRPWVIFDFGGVILTMKDKSAYRDKMEAVMETIQYPVRDVSTFKKRVYGGPEFAAAKEGRISSREMWRQIFENPDLSACVPLSNDEHAQVAAEVTAQCDASSSDSSLRKLSSSLDDATIDRLRDHVRLDHRHVDTRLVAYVEDLKRRGVGVGILSNYESDLMEVLEGLGLRGTMVEDAHVVSSSDIGVAKPNATAFHKAMEKLRVEPVVLGVSELDILEMAKRQSLAGERVSENDSIGSPLPSEILSSRADSSLLTEDSLSPVISQLSFSKPRASSVMSASGDPVSAQEPGLCYPNVVFIDDKESNVSAARRCGIVHSIHYKNLDQCIQQIEACLRTIACLPQRPTTELRSATCSST